jgi:hypothetical protein
MFRSHLHRLFAVLVVSLTLTTPLCEAASPGSAARRARQAASIPSHSFGLWDWLTNLWAKNGCSIDPGGHCVKSQSAADGGCGIDPGGLCSKSQSAADGGCGIDPNGSTTCHGHS